MFKAPYAGEDERAEVKRISCPVHYWFSSLKIYVTSNSEPESYR